MVFERACYSRSALRECVERVKATAWTVRTKGQHFSKCFEVEKVFDFCLEKTGCCLFETQFGPWADYLRLVDLKAPKKDLDAALRRCYRFLANELTGILTMIETGEVDAQD